MIPLKKIIFGVENLIHENIPINKLLPLCHLSFQSLKNINTSILISVFDNKHPDLYKN